MSEDELVPVESLRSQRADRRASRKRRLRRALRVARVFRFSPTKAEVWAQRHADTMTRCSCWLCRPYRVFRDPDLRDRSSAFAIGISRIWWGKG